MTSDEAFLRANEVALGWLQTRGEESTKRFLKARIDFYREEVERAKRNNVDHHAVPVPDGR